MRTGEKLFRYWLIISIFLASFVLADAEPTTIPNGFDKTCVQFVFSKRPDGTFYPDGTCFTVSVSNYHFPHIFIPFPFIGKPMLTYYTRYIVTAKHVLYDESGNLRDNLYLRADNQNGGIQYDYINSDITNGNVRILMPKDRSVDMVVIAVNEFKTNRFAIASSTNSAPKLRIGFLNSSFIVSEDKFNSLNITEGYDMFFIGLFLPFYGAKENIPICRFGHLAMKSNESIPWMNGNQTLYLMETEAFGGNSGSPVFFTSKKTIVPNILSKLFTRNQSDNKIILAGVLIGYFNDWQKVNEVEVSVKTLGLNSNDGIAAVVPASYLYDILFSKDEKDMRKREFKKLFPLGYF